MTEPIEQVRSWITDSLPRMRRFARAITSNNESADDLVQASIERALHGASQALTDMPFNRWILSIMCNVSDAASARSSPERSPEDEIDGPLRAALVRLPREQRVAVALVLIEGLSYREAAEALAVPVDIMTRHLTRGRETLQALL